MRSLGKILIAGAIAWSGIVPGNPIARAQSNGDREQGVKIVASPKGTLVRLEGEYTVSGTAPFTIIQNLDGLYKIRAKLPGYEEYTTKHLFKPGVSQRISIRLTRKTRSRAVVRSLFVPGWGQSYTDQPTKSIFIRVATLGSLGYLLHTELKYQNAVEEFEKAVQLYEANQKDLEQVEILIGNVQSAQGNVDKRYERRRTALFIAGSVYLYNLLDALFYFPDFQVSGFRLSLDAVPETGGVRLGLSAGF